MEIVRIQHQKRIKDIKNEYKENDGRKLLKIGNAIGKIILEII
jgi:hypothetical protein